MGRTVTGLTPDLLAQLPELTQRCAFWELDPVQRAGHLTPHELVDAKREWVSATLLEWGSCGQVVTVDGEHAGFVMYAPAAFVPSADSFATSPISRDSVLLMTGSVYEPFRRTGLGRVLVQSMIKDLVRRRIRGVEAFATHRSQRCAGDPAVPCLLPAGFLSHVGFRTVRPHPLTPRMRLDVRATVTWRSDVEQAVDRLLGSIRQPAPAALTSTDR